MRTIFWSITDNNAAVFQSISKSKLNQTVAYLYQKLTSELPIQFNLCNFGCNGSIQFHDAIVFKYWISYNSKSCEQQFRSKNYSNKIEMNTFVLKKHTHMGVILNLYPRVCFY